MKKCLLLIAVIIVSQLNTVYSQTEPTTLFSGPDTVCINQPVKLKSNVFNQSSYYWGFCSGFLFNPPTGTNLGDNFGFSIPTGIDIVNDSGTYYGFVINSRTDEFLKLNFGNSLSNIPTVNNLGSITRGLPTHPNSLFIVRDTLAHHWHVFVSGGTDASNSSLARIDFGLHINNTPNIANFHNPGGLLNCPKGVFVAQDASHQWVGYVVNYNTNELIMLDFSFNVSNTPLATNMGNVDNRLTTPTDMAAIKDNGNWYLFVTNYTTSELIRITLGPDLNPVPPTVPTAENLHDYNFRILNPSSLSITRDCNAIHIYITDSNTSQLVRVSGATAANITDSVDYSVVGGMNFPSSISSILRDKDNLYAFITNGADSTLTRIALTPCTNATIPSYTDVNPPVYSYNTPGVYNIYYVVNDGKPNMQVACKDITVLPPPPIYMNPDTTICRGDTARLYAVSTLADSIIWTSTNNIDTTYMYRDSVRVFPNASTSYGITLYYPFGCIVDTQININVLKVTADAGPDRFIKDGAITTLGGPYTSIDNETPFNTGKYLYHWEPYQFMVDSTVPNAVVNPPYDFTYYLTVTEIDGEVRCLSRDTVVVHINCGEINVPNAFSPTSSNPGANRFGILNKEISKLNYFRVFNRYGQLVFQTTDPTQKWDGLFNGTLAEEGVYVWEADAFCLSGKEIHKKGNVTLFR